MAKAAFWMTVATWVQVWVAVVGTFLLLLALYYSREATKAATDTARAALKANELQRDVLIAEQRAWIPIRQKDVRIVSPLEWDKQNASLSVQVSLQNIGRTPAHGVWFEAEIQLNGVRQPIEAVSKRARGDAMRISDHVIFPNDEPYQFTFQTILSGRVIEEHAKYESAATKAERTPDEVVLFIKIVGCIDYGIVSKEERRRTAFVADLARIKDGKIRAIRRAGGKVPLEELFLAVRDIVAD